MLASNHCFQRKSADALILFEGCNPHPGCFAKELKVRRRDRDGGEQKRGCGEGVGFF
jgi:hypothetical protein